MAVMPTAEPTAAAKMLEDGAAGAEASPDVAHELSAEEVAASSHLSLELESFCAYTVVQRDGLLLPASIDFVAKYRERLYGFVDQAALDAFVAEPAKYLTAVLSAAKRMPELIHMLRLQEYFPAASIAEIMRQYSQGVVGTGGQSLLSAPRSFQDSCVQASRSTHAAATRAGPAAAASSSQQQPAAASSSQQQPARPPACARALGPFSHPVRPRHFSSVCPRSRHTALSRATPLSRTAAPARLTPTAARASCRRRRTSSRRTSTSRTSGTSGPCAGARSTWPTCAKRSPSRSRPTRPPLGASRSR
eukprot:3073577-Prymnesium_polylepis.1